jgi:hypothetical protein
MARPAEAGYDGRVRRWLPVLLGTTALLAAGCARSYAPGLGELMSLNQMRHAKLWFAGRDRNWPLARYEVDELQEGLDDVVRYHPVHEGSPLPLSALVPKIMDPPLAEMRRAIETEDPRAFLAAYDDLTAGCNGCHRAANFGFNVVKRPEGEGWFANQEFTPASP